jgi:hypothetical protein
MLAWHDPHRSEFLSVTAQRSVAMQNTGRSAERAGDVPRMVQLGRVAVSLTDQTAAEAVLQAVFRYRSMLLPFIELARGGWCARPLIERGETETPPQTCDSSLTAASRTPPSPA